MGSMHNFVFLFILFPFLAAAQIKEFDQVEMLYDQGHYKKVLRRSNRLLDNPEYDFSMIPTYYKSLALFQLYRDDNWRKRNGTAFDEAIALFQEVKKEDTGGKIFRAHYYELQALKQDLQSFALLCKQTGNEELFAKINTALTASFSGIEGLDELESIVETVESSPEMSDKGDDHHGTERAKLVAFAQSYVGVPYKPGGMDPKGFDCSGFTSYVFEKYNRQLPRIARDQQRSSRKKDMGGAQPGDLIFFSSGSGVNHVGIVVENQDKSIKMVHASTSQGIIITDVQSSTYWSRRVHSVGSYLD